MTDLPSLPRFPISIILSYLQQSTPPTPPTQNNNGARTSNNNDTTAKTAFPLPHNRDALSFLLTNKRLSYSILPLFKVPKHICRNYEQQTNDGTWISIVEKYRFTVLPIQDPITLLDRLNTKRLRGRIVWLKRLQNNKTPRHNDDDGLQQDEESTAQDGIEVNLHDATISSDTTSSNDHQHTANSNNNNNNRLNEHTSCYQYGRTIEELAFEEWALMQINHNNSTTQKEEENYIQQWRMWPAHLELLRFLDNDNDSRSARNGEIYEQSSQGSRYRKLISGQRRIIPSPFCFNKQFKNTTTTTTGSTAAKNNTSTMNVQQQTFGNDITLLASYPRSGNTLLRTLLERTTSIVTGSDTRPDRTLSKSLALDHGLVGEGLVGPGQMINHQPKTTRMKTKKSKSTTTSSSQQEILYQTAYDPQVHIVKTHFPERKGWKPVPGNKVLLLVRNPYDAIDSYWNLCCTNTHTRSLDESVYVKYAKKFEDLVKHEIEIWCKFHYYWMDICEKENVPILIVRYEDLVLNTEGEMMRVIEFLMNGNNNFDDDSASIMKSFWEWRIRHAIGKTEANATNTSNLGSYQPRSSSGGILSIGKSIRKKRYSESVLCHIHDVAVSMELDRKQNSTASKLHALKSDKQQSNNKTLLQRFGYDIYSQQFPENFKQRPLPELLPSPPHSVFGKGNNTGTVVINKTPEIRNKEDPFGRAMTYWRRGETDGDRNPFPTVPR